MKCFLMVGPTAFAVNRALLEQSDVVVMPPACRGSLHSLQSYARGPACVAIVDGNFHQVLAVGHREILDLLKAGWPVWGLASMGAVRAAEMQHLGMQGFGTVFERFAQSPQLPDDEVAQLHAPDPPYLPLTEPMIHHREALYTLERHGILTSVLRRNVTSMLEAMWFGDRTVKLILEMLSEYLGKKDLEVAYSHLRDFKRYRVKTFDLIRFLEEKPWKDAPR